MALFPFCWDFNRSKLMNNFRTMHKMYAVRWYFICSFSGRALADYYLFRFTFAGYLHVSNSLEGCIAVRLWKWPFSKSKFLVVIILCASSGCFLNFDHVAVCHFKICVTFVIQARDWFFEAEICMHFLFLHVFFQKISRFFLFLVHIFIYWLCIFRIK